MATFQVKVLTPAGEAFEETVTAVKMQAADGEIGVLPQHVQYTAVLGDGELECSLENGQQKKVHLGGGFCRFSNNTLTILADSMR